MDWAANVVGHTRPTTVGDQLCDHGANDFFNDTPTAGDIDGGELGMQRYTFESIVFGLVIFALIDD